MLRENQVTNLRMHKIENLFFLSKFNLKNKFFAVIDSKESKFDVKYFLLMLV